VWAIFSTLDPRVLQFKPGILLSPDLVDEVLDRTEVSIGQALRAPPRRAGGGRMSERPRGSRRARARMMLQRAHWAATAFAGYDRERHRVGSSTRSPMRHTKRRKVCRWAVSGDRHGRRRAQAPQERGLLARASSSGTAARTT
jgi:hypothetical protein